MNVTVLAQKELHYGISEGKDSLQNSTFAQPSDLSEETEIRAFTSYFLQDCLELRMTRSDVVHILHNVIHDVVETKLFQAEHLLLYVTVALHDIFTLLWTSRLLRSMSSNYGCYI